jgi:hypothetical protein
MTPADVAPSLKRWAGWPLSAGSWNDVENIEAKDSYSVDSDAV